MLWQAEMCISDETSIARTFSNGEINRLDASILSLGIV